MGSKVAVCYCLHDDHWFVEHSVRSFAQAGPVFAFVSQVAWNGSQGDWERCAEAAEAGGARVILGDWPGEELHRQSAYAELVSQGFEAIITADGDEIIEPTLLDAIVRIAEADVADRLYVHWDTYWRDPDHVVRPREPFTPLMMFRPGPAHHVFRRDYEGGRPLVLGPEHGVVHHLSYAGPDDRIWRKITTWGHRDEILDGWWEQVWKGWEQAPLLRDVHPTHPESYRSIEHIPRPAPLREIPTYREAPEPVEIARSKERVSVVIPLYGGESDIRQCLESLRRCDDLIQEIIVVDNASPDRAAEIAEDFTGVQVHRLDANRGFAAACNVGFERSTGEIVVFLNSDTIVPPVGLGRLLESLLSSGTVGAVGPMSNRVLGPQQIEPTYTNLDSLDLFAEDFARRNAPDLDADFAVGFCLAVRRRALEDVGKPFDEAFGIGTFEDNDLCYRLRRAGYRILIAGRAFVHHSGSATFRRMDLDMRRLLRKNGDVFARKWREDLELGYASHLSGWGGGRIVFRPDRHPERFRADMRSLALRADVTLCMIVRNEERVLADCLRSALPFFRQIVVVDTGSTDTTVEIAKSFGAEVHEVEWTDSFAEARNESLKHAKGRWFFWMDADDTLPLQSGEAILRAALSAPPEVGAFVVPVQFVDDGPSGGTRVDHVKLVRNLPGISFEGRIHEQVLPSVRDMGLGVARCEAVVFHSGYDTSAEGQTRKRERDWRLLELDLKERPGHPFVLFNLGMTAHFTGRHAEAVDWLGQSMAAAASANESHIPKAQALRIGSLRALGRREEALEEAVHYLRTAGAEPEINFQAAVILTDMGRFEEAVAHYQAVRPHDGGEFSSIDQGIVSYKLAHNLGALLLRLGRYEEGRQELLRAHAAAPNHSASLELLIEAALHHHDWATCRHVLDDLRNREGHTERWAIPYSHYLDAAVGNAACERALWEAARERPGEPGPELVLARRYLASSRRQRGRAMLRMLADGGVPEAAFYLAQDLEATGDRAGALDWIERALAVVPDDPAFMDVRNRLRAPAMRN